MTGRERVQLAQRDVDARRAPSTSVRSLARTWSAWTGAAEAAIRASDEVLTAEDRGVAQNAVGDELRVFDKVGSVELHAQ